MPYQKLDTNDQVTTEALSRDRLPKPPKQDTSKMQAVEDDLQQCFNQSACLRLYTPVDSLPRKT